MSVRKHYTRAVTLSERAAKAWLVSTVAGAAGPTCAASAVIKVLRSKYIPTNHYIRSLIIADQYYQLSDFRSSPDWRNHPKHMNRVIGGFLILFFCLIPFIAGAASIRVQSGGGSGESTIIILDGEIQQGDAKRFRALVAARSIQGIIIRSSGGLISEALDVGRVVADMRIPVQAQNICASACTLILLSSPNRLMTRDTRIGFHSAATASGEAHSATVSLSRIYRDLGVPNEVLGGLVTHRPSEMYWITARQSNIMGITTSHSILNNNIPNRADGQNWIFPIGIVVVLLLLSGSIFIYLFLLKNKRHNKSQNYGLNYYATPSARPHGAAASLKTAQHNGTSHRGFVWGKNRTAGKAGTAAANMCATCGRQLPGARFKACPACGTPTH